MAMPTARKSTNITGMRITRSSTITNAKWAATGGNITATTRGEGFRDEDRLPRDWEPRLRVGFVFDRDWRARCYPVPPDLYAELPPPPPHYRYYVIGGHVVLVDHGWRVADVININF